MTHTASSAADGPAIETNRRAVLEFLRTRRSPKLRELGAPAPSDAELRLMLTVASRVPDHGKLVPWRFVVIRGDRRDRLNEFIGECFDADNPGAVDDSRAEARRRLAYAPIVVAVVFSPKEHAKVPKWEQTLSVGACCMNLLNAAKAMGFAALWLTEWYAFDRRVLGELGLTETEQLAGFMHIGTEREPRDDRARPDLDRIVTEY